MLDATATAHLAEVCVIISLMGVGLAIGALAGWIAGLALGRMVFRTPIRTLRMAEIGNPLLALAATFAV